MLGALGSVAVSYEVSVEPEDGKVRVVNTGL